MREGIPDRGNDPMQVKSGKKKKIHDMSTKRKIFWADIGSSVVASVLAVNRNGKCSRSNSSSRSCCNSLVWKNPSYRTAANKYSSQAWFSVPLPHTIITSAGFSHRSPKHWTEFVIRRVMWPPQFLNVAYTQWSMNGKRFDNFKRYETTHLSTMILKIIIYMTLTVDVVTKNVAKSRVRHIEDFLRTLSRYLCSHFLNLLEIQIRI